MLFRATEAELIPYTRGYRPARSSAVRPTGAGQGNSNARFCTFRRGPPQRRDGCWLALPRRGNEAIFINFFTATAGGGGAAAGALERLSACYTSQQQPVAATVHDQVAHLRKHHVVVANTIPRRRQHDAVADCGAMDDGGGCKLIRIK